jgi:flagellum-specific ATP synthase
MVDAEHLDSDAIWRSAAATFSLCRKQGRVTRISELAIESVGPKVSLGDVCDIFSPANQAVQAEVVAVREGRVVMVPYAQSRGLAVGAIVQTRESQPAVFVGRQLLGRVVNAFGEPIDDGPEFNMLYEAPLHPDALNPLKRSSINAQLETGLRAIDALLPVGKGQRIGIFSGSGVGKSSLMGMLARNVASDTNVVALIGERGREVREFLTKGLSDAARSRTVVVVATAEQPAVVRARAAYTATAIAEWFRSQGDHVFMLMDSITRFAMARREIDLASGQPPAARGYTPSVFSALPALCERCGGLQGKGSITAAYTVLVEGDDTTEPIADTLRAALDGHILLSRELANEGHFPAIDVLQSVSRLDVDLLSPQDLASAHQLRSLLSVHLRQRDMVDMGLYKAGANKTLDQALASWPAITQFLRQGVQEVSSMETTKHLLRSLLAGGGGR